MFLTGKNVTLLVSGSIACYKSCELVRMLVKAGARVRVAMSKNATNFVSPLTFQTLTNEPVFTEFFNLELEHKIGHISLADDADIIVSAPSSANIMAKVAHGIADDLLSTIILATTKKVLFVPAMNVNMWRNKITKENVEKLKKVGYQVLDPDIGELACGWVGEGRFPEVERIFSEIEYCVAGKKLQGTKIVVTAGPTREPIDPVRYMSNISSGKMGYALAKVARNLGAEVILISGPSQEKVPFGVTFVRVTSAEEMKEAVMANLSSKVGDKIKKQILLKAAAVADHKPLTISKEKLKKSKSENYSLELTPCSDVLRQVGAQRADIEARSGVNLTIVGFTAETGTYEDMKSTAREKLTYKNCDFIVGNLVSESMGLDTNRICIVMKDGKIEDFVTQDKYQVAENILRYTLGDF